jgi:hypothetical protein
MVQLYDVRAVKAGAGEQLLRSGPGYRFAASAPLLTDEFCVFWCKRAYSFEI